MSSPLPHEEAGAMQAAGAAQQPTLLEPALWQRLTDAEASEELAAAWLALQCAMIPGATRGIVLAAGEAKLTPIAAWPNAGPQPDLAETARLAAEERRPVARGTSAEAHVTPSIGYPVIIDGEVAAVAALAVGVSSLAQARDELRSAIRQLQWGAAWLRDHLRRQSASADGRQLDRSRATLDFIASVLEHERFAPAAMAAATELAIRFDCARVSIGFVRRGAARIAAISHSAQFGRQMSLVRSIGAAMDEAIDQRCSILYPVAADQALASQAHAELARVQHDGQVLTVPLFVVDAFIGAITFERTKGHPFEPELVKLLDVVATAIGPILEEKRRNDRWLVVKAGESLALQARRLLGPSYFGRKLALAAVGLLALFFTFATDTYRVNADASVEGAQRRAVVSAYDGYIQSASVRAGELVEAGQTLATLEDRELALERLRWTTERQQHVFEYDRALAAREPSTINVTRSRIEQADAQIRLIDEQIARTKLVAPFDGLVVSGDLSQRIGSAVSRGETLFEIAPLAGYRVVMQVDERQIADVEAGQSGDVVFTSLPNESFPLVVDKVTPVAETRDGRNLFKVEGSLVETSERLRPGMIGVAKIEVEEQPLILIWLRPVIDWFRIATWRWMP